MEENQDLKLKNWKCLKLNYNKDWFMIFIDLDFFFVSNLFLNIKTINLKKCSLIYIILTFFLDKFYSWNKKVNYKIYKY